ncbi:hypothetical protein H2514_00110 [Lysobacter sp. CW239]|uniref:hypothetical protein n=1 Tax=Lysobacteraceae TaxID=32033 RepID=UPI001745D6A7|nr:MULTISPECIES: hypothetical protein [Lysobacter]QOD91139.1 hypothetical protein H2514_00110 [Lysobacter sp. CW239]
MTDTPDAAEAAPSAQDLFIAGAAALDRYQAHDAADLLRQAALLDPDNPEVALYLARAGDAAAHGRGRGGNRTGALVGPG